MGLFDKFKKKTKEDQESVEILHNLVPNRTYFIPKGMCSNGISGEIKFGTLKVGDFCKANNADVDYIFEIAEIYDDKNNSITEAVNGQSVSLYTKVNGKGYRCFSILEKID